MESQSPVSYTLPELVDEGTKNLRAISSFESDVCAVLSYEISPDYGWITQDLSDDRLITISVNEDPSLMGDHILELQID